MPICVECRYPVQNLYTTYSKADDRSSGKGVRLTQCPRCKRFADKYVEHDFVVLFIDLVLIKPQVYRHLLFNRLGREDDRFDPSIVRVGILLLLFDVYLTWARIEKASPTPIRNAHADAYNSTPDPAYHSYPPSPLSNQPLVLQYLFFLFLCTATTLAFHLPIRLLCAHPPRLPSSFSPGFAKRPLAVLANSIPFYPHPTTLSTALLVSSCTKLFPILLIIWEYDLPSSASAVSWAVIVNNVAALEILVGCGYVSAAVLVGIGAACRAVVAELILGAVGLRERAWFTDAGFEAVVGAVRRWYRA